MNARYRTIRIGRNMTAHIQDTKRQGWDGKRIICNSKIWHKIPYRINKKVETSKDIFHRHHDLSGNITCFKCIDIIFDIMNKEKQK